MQTVESKCHVKANTECVARHIETIKLRQAQSQKKQRLDNAAHEVNEVQANVLELACGAR